MGKAHLSTYMSSGNPYSNGESAGMMAMSFLNGSSGKLDFNWGDGGAVEGNFAEFWNAIISKAMSASGSGVLYGGGVLAGNLGSPGSSGNDGEAVGGVSVRDFPSNGLFTEGLFSYDLHAFDKFYRDYGKRFKASKLIGADGESVDLADVKDITLDDKPVGTLYSEAQSYLSIVSGGFSNSQQTFLITVGANMDPSRKGTSFTFNQVHLEHSFIPIGKINATIHTHPDWGTMRFLQHNIFSRRSIVAQGPTYPSDYTSYSQYRNVVVDSQYIYLINSKPSENIIFKRP